MALGIMPLSIQMVSYAVFCSHAEQLYFECHDENVSEKIYKIIVPNPEFCFENNFFLDINQAGFSLKRTVVTNVVIMTKCQSY